MLERNKRSQLFMANKKENPSSIRSKQLIRTSLLELMESNEYNKITIKDICENAGLARNTFYCNFSSKEDILSYHAKILAEEYLLKIKENTSMDIYMMVEGYFTFWYENKSFLEKIIKNEYLSYIKYSEEQFKLYFVDCITSTKKDSDFNYNPYTIAFIVGGLTNMLSCWFENNFTETPQQLTEYYIQMLEYANPNK